MERINSINPQEATGITKILLDDVQKRLGMTPSMMRSMNQEERLVKEHGHVTDNDLTKIRKAGFSDGAIAEVIANVALNIFTNYFNLVAEPRVYFPIVPSLAEPQG